MIEFFVHGAPVPQGSKRVYGGNVVETGGARLRSWRTRCSEECAAKMNGEGPLDGPISVRVAFMFQRPKSHFGTGKNGKRLKHGMPKAPATRPDADKLARALLDAMTGIAFKDDAQVARLWVEKQWTPLNPGVQVSFWPID